MALNLNKLNCVSFAQKGVAGHFSDFVVGCPYFVVDVYDPDEDRNRIQFHVSGHPELVFYSVTNAHLTVYTRDGSELKQIAEYVVYSSSGESNRFYGMAIGDDDIYILTEYGYNLGGTTSYNNANFKNLAAYVMPLKRLVCNFNSNKAGYIYYRTSREFIYIPMIKDLISGDTVINNSINQSGIDCEDLINLVSTNVSANYAFSDNNNSIQLSPWYINGGYYNSEIAVQGMVADSRYVGNIMVGDSQYTLKRVTRGGYICI